jgi:2-oxoglutarate/2-oxoacid ferredoxin oxidoreductase subunit alpha
MARDTHRHRVEERDAVTIRLVGDSGDGMFLAGTRFTHTAQILGNHTLTQPTFPAEIRAPAGTLAGVSGFQIHFSAEAEPLTPCDQLDALVVMNPAALKTNLADLRPGGILLANRNAFTRDLDRAGYTTNPLEDGSLTGYRLLSVPITELNGAAVANLNLSHRETDRCKTFFALGLLYWLFERPLEPTLRWIADRFARNPNVAEANARSLRAGYHHGDTTSLLPVHYRVNRAPLPPGQYRHITGSEAIALGLAMGAHGAGLPLFFACAPTPPVSDILHHLADLKQLSVTALPMEDDTAACAAAVGASFGGSLGATAANGPGISLGAEVVGLAVMTELPLVVVDMQRGGPSNGLPTKTEQSDLLQVLFGRNGECPLPVLAPHSPSDCFDIAVEAARLAVRYMTPVVVLSDNHLSHAAEPWRVPTVAELPRFPASFAAPREPGAPPFLPYGRDERGARPWAIPGTPGLEHRVGGLEKEAGTGNVNYEPDNHERMVQMRARKIANVAKDVPPLTVDGPAAGEVLVVSWGSTFGAVRSAARRVNQKGALVAHADMRYLNPFPSNMREILSRYRKVLIAELNGGQLLFLLRARYLVDAVGLNRVRGTPFQIGEIEKAVEELLAAPGGAA